MYPSHFFCFLHNQLPKPLFKIVLFYSFSPTASRGCSKQNIILNIKQILTLKITYTNFVWSKRYIGRIVELTSCIGILQKMYCVGVDELQKVFGQNHLKLIFTVLLFELLLGKVIFDEKTQKWKKSKSFLLFFNQNCLRSA